MGIELVKPIEVLRAAFAARVAPSIALYKQTALEFQAFTASFHVTNPVSQAFGNEQLGRLLEQKDSLERLRQMGPGALGALVREWNAVFKTASDVFETGERALRKQLGDYEIAERDREAAAFAAAKAAHVAGEHEAATAALQVASETRTNAAEGLSVRVTWRVAHIDPEQVPRAWMIPDEKRIAAHARAAKDAVPAEIPGVIFERVAATSKARGK